VTHRADAAQVTIGRDAAPKAPNLESVPAQEIRWFPQASLVWTARGSQGLGFFG
jgi:hypothetical protein